MRFPDFYKDNTFRYSAEIFPPKTSAGIDRLLKEVEQLKKIDPSYISITYGAMGSTHALTREIALLLKNDLKVNVAFHFTCVGLGRKEIKEYIETMLKHEINMVLALRGDVPRGQENFEVPQDGFGHANELVAYLKEIHPELSIAVAGYPEIHVEAESMQSDLDYLKQKVNAGADAIVTQLFFDNQDFYSYRDSLQKMQVNPVLLPGILPVQNLKQVQRFTQMCGAKFPAQLKSQLEVCDGDADKMHAVGVTHASQQCRDLIQSGVSGIHFYSLNRADSILEIVDNCS